ncbi:MAG: hypothetical protein LBF12_07010 [Christensenellaceae bacterium]|jgi:hypothetical protein|nr:hypothetical protein [Christensenellaceae bacterium]
MKISIIPKSFFVFVYVLLFIGLQIVALVFLTKTSIEKASADTNVNTTYNGGYSLLSNDSTKSDISDHTYYVTTYKIYVSNKIYKNTGLLLVVPPTSYKKGTINSITQTEALTFSYNMSTSVTNTISTKLNAEIGGEYNKIKSKIATELTTAISRTYAISSSTTYEISVSRLTQVSADYDGYYGCITMTEQSKHCVIKMSVTKYTEKKNGAGTYNGEYSAETIYSEKEVFSELIPYYINDKFLFYYHDIKVWKDPMSFYNDLYNLPILDAIENERTYVSKEEADAFIELLISLLSIFKF